MGFWSFVHHNRRHLALLALVALLLSVKDDGCHVRAGCGEASIGPAIVDGGAE